MVDAAEVVILLTVEVELRGNGGDEELDGVEIPPDDSPEVYGEVPVGMIEEYVLVLDLLWRGVV
jgi:hypothetical protein